MALVDDPAAQQLDPHQQQLGASIAGHPVPSTWQVLDMDDGSQFVGQTAAGKPHGRGVLLLRSGDRYEGHASLDWREGSRFGIGRYTYRDGAVYFGEYRAGYKHGFGELRYANTDTYRGFWNKGSPHGFGVYMYAGGDVYVGQFLEGKPHGAGMMLYENESEFAGEWASGVRDGVGAQVWPDATVLEGTWSLDRFERGLKVDPDGNVNAIVTRDGEIVSSSPIQRTRSAANASASPEKKGVTPALQRLLRRTDTMALMSEPRDMRFGSADPAPGSRESIAVPQSPVTVVVVDPAGGGRVAGSADIAAGAGAANASHNERMATSWLHGDEISLERRFALYVRQSGYMMQVVLAHEVERLDQHWTANEMREKVNEAELTATAARARYVQLQERVGDLGVGTARLVATARFVRCLECALARAAASAQRVDPSPGASEARSFVDMFEARQDDGGRAMSAAPFLDDDAGGAAMSLPGASGLHDAEPMPLGATNVFGRQVASVPSVVSVASEITAGASDAQPVGLGPSPNRRRLRSLSGSDASDDVGGERAAGAGDNAVSEYPPQFSVSVPQKSDGGEFAIDLLDERESARLLELCDVGNTAMLARALEWLSQTPVDAAEVDVSNADTLLSVVGRGLQGLDPVRMASSLRNAVRAAQNLLAQRRRLQAEISQLRARVALAAENVKRAETKQKELTEELRMANERVEHMRRELDAQKDGIHQEQSRFDSLTRLAERIPRLEETILESERAMQRKNDAMLAVQKELEDALEALRMARMHSEMLQDKCHGLERELHQRTASVHEASQDAHEQRKQVSLEREATETLRAELIEARERHKRLEKQWQTDQASLLERITGAQQRIEALERARDEEHVKRINLERALEQAQSEQRELNAMLRVERQMRQVMDSRSGAQPYQPPQQYGSGDATGVSGKPQSPLDRGGPGHQLALQQHAPSGGTMQQAGAQMGAAAGPSGVDGTAASPAWRDPGGGARASPRDGPSPAYAAALRRSASRGSSSNSLVAPQQPQRQEAHWEQPSRGYVDDNEPPMQYDQQWMPSQPQSHAPAQPQQQQQRYVQQLPQHQQPQPQPQPQSGSHAYQQQPQQRGSYSQAQPYGYAAAQQYPQQQPAPQPYGSPAVPGSAVQAERRSPSVGRRASRHDSFVLEVESNPRLRRELHEQVVDCITERFDNLRDAFENMAPAPQQTASSDQIARALQRQGFDMPMEIVETLVSPYRARPDGLSYMELVRFVSDRGGRAAMAAVAAAQSMPLSRRGPLEEGNEPPVPLAPSHLMSAGGRRAAGPAGGYAGPSSSPAAFQQPQLQLQLQPQPQHAPTPHFPPQYPEHDDDLDYDGAYRTGPAPVTGTGNGAVHARVRGQPDSAVAAGPGSRRGGTPQQSSRPPSRVVVPASSPAQVADTLIHLCLNRHVAIAMDLFSTNSVASVLSKPQHLVPFVGSFAGREAIQQLLNQWIDWKQRMRSIDKLATYEPQEGVALSRSRLELPPNAASAVRVAWAMEELTVRVGPNMRIREISLAYSPAQ